MGLHETGVRRALESEERRLVFVDREEYEWRRMWEALAHMDCEDGGCPDDMERLHPETLDAWQYMGTIWQEGGNGRARSWVHQFRHRNHPVTNRRVYWEVSASPGWAPRRP